MKTSLFLLAFVLVAWTGCGSDDDSSAETSAAQSNGGGPPSGAGGDTAQAIPCEVQKVLQSRCQVCHADPPVGEAPIPLVTYAQIQATHGGGFVWEHMKEAVETDFMPPDPMPKLQGEERSTLLDWLEDGAPAGDACE